MVGLSPRVGGAVAEGVLAWHLRDLIILPNDNGRCIWLEQRKWVGTKDLFLAATRAAEAQAYSPGHYCSIEPSSTVPTTCIVLYTPLQNQISTPVTSLHNGPRTPLVFQTCYCELKLEKNNTRAARASVLCSELCPGLCVCG